MSRDPWDEYSNTILVRYVLSYLCGTLYLDLSVSLKRIFAFSVGGLFSLSTHALTCFVQFTVISFFFLRDFHEFKLRISFQKITARSKVINHSRCELMKRRDFFQKLRNAQLTITDVMWMLLARIPWAHTNVLAKLDTLEMAANALVSTEVCFRHPYFALILRKLTDFILFWRCLLIKKVVSVSLVSFYGHHTVYVQCCN